MDDRYVLDWPVVGADLCAADLADDLHALDNLPEDRVFAVKEIVVHQVDEELGTPGVRSGICHGNRPPVILIVVRELIFDRVSRATHTGTGRVSTLDHKPADNTVKDHAIIVAFFHERLKIAGSYRHFRVECDGNVAHIRLEPYQFLDLC